MIRRSSHARGLVVGVVFLAGCHASGPARAPAPETGAPIAATPPLAGAGTPIERLARALPDTAPPFVAGPAVAETGFVRRRYTRGAIAIEITIAAFPQSPGEFAQWIAQSRAYPQALLSLAPEEANGFFSCAGAGTTGACDLHIQLRGGFHVEVMGGGRATRNDIDLLMTRIPLAMLVRSP